MFRSRDVCSPVFATLGPIACGSFCGRLMGEQARRWQDSYRAQMHGMSCELGSWAWCQQRMLDVGAQG